MKMLFTSKGKIITILTKRKMMTSSTCQVFLLQERTRLNARYAGGNFFYYLVR